jgi:hypothetical protein
MGGSMSGSERSFYAGLLIIALDMGLYGWRGLPSGTHDLLFHAMPMTLGFALMVPKLFPNLTGAVTQIFGRWRSTP